LFYYAHVILQEYFSKKKLFKPLKKLSFLVPSLRKPRLMNADTELLRVSKKTILTVGR